MAKFSPYELWVVTSNWANGIEGYQIFTSKTEANDYLVQTVNEKYRVDYKVLTLVEAVNLIRDQYLDDMMQEGRYGYYDDER